jgi:biopolymer transport protein ExbD
MRNLRFLPSSLKSRTRMQMRMVPMIDVVFLLLVFFLLAANYRSREGFLPSELPRQETAAESAELEPLFVYLHSRADGACEVDIGSEISFVIGPASEGGDFSVLGRELLNVIKEQHRSLDDAVKLVPGSDTKWDHVVKAYDAMWQIELRQIIFAVAE